MSLRASGKLDLTRVVRNPQRLCNPGLEGSKLPKAASNLGSNAQAVAGASWSALWPGLKQWPWPKRGGGGGSIRAQPSLFERRWGIGFESTSSSWCHSFPASNSSSVSCQPRKATWSHRWCMCTCLGLQTCDAMPSKAITKLGLRLAQQPLSPQAGQPRRSGEAKKEKLHISPQNHRARESESQGAAKGPSKAAMKP